MPEGSTPELPRVAVLVRVTDADGPALADLVADTAAQEDVVARLVVLDATTDGLAFDDPAVQLVRTPGPSRGAAWATGCAAVDEPLVALALPGCRRLPTHLAQAARALQAGGELATCDLLLTRRGQVVDRANPAAMDGRPGPC